MAEERPVTAFTLSVVGVSLQAVAGSFAAYWRLFAFPYVRGGDFMSLGMMGPWMMGGMWGFPFMEGFGAPFMWFGLVVVIVALGVMGALWLNTSDVGKVRTGSTLVLVTSIFAFPTMWGFMIGSLLMFIGSILGLTWQSTTGQVL